MDDFNKAHLEQPFHLIKQRIERHFQLTRHARRSARRPDKGRKHPEDSGFEQLPGGFRRFNAQLGSTSKRFGHLQQHSRNFSQAHELRDRRLMNIHALSTGTIRVKTNHLRGRGQSRGARVLNLFTDADWSGTLPIYVWVVEHP